MDKMDIVDQQLLRQFSCLGTTDKDELIKQFQMLIGNNTNSSTANFFLDMNNWNLQAAVGSFFDFGTPTKLPSMCLVKDNFGNSDVLTVPPSTEIRKAWMLLNNGDELWPEGCYLQFSGGDIMSSWERLRIIGPVLPGQTSIVVADLKSPSTPGFYKSKWRLSTPSGIFFGDIIWLIMSVTDNEPTELVKQMSNLNTYGDSPSTFRSGSNCVVNPFGLQQQQQHSSTLQKPDE